MLSLVVSVVTLVGIWLLRRKDWRGWVVGLANQSLWIALAITSREWGLLVLTAALIYQYTRGIIEWRRAEVCEPDDPHADENEPVHLWFSLSYANYLVLHRSLMQSMPVEWQRRMVCCLDELDDAYRHVEKPISYQVQARDDSGKFVADPIPHYSRGRTFIPPILRETKS